MKVEEKVCRFCKILKPASEFYGHKHRRDGLQSECKFCAKNVMGYYYNCENCSAKFKTRVNKRKLKLCSDCLKMMNIQRTVAVNKARAKDERVCKKGYKILGGQETISSYIFSHRKEMEKHLGRKLVKTEVVHHIDLDKTNNDIENLFLTDSFGHSKAHRTLVLAAVELFHKGLIRFNRQLGEYELTGDEMVAVPDC